MSTKKEKTKTIPLKVFNNIMDQLDYAIDFKAEMINNLKYIYQNAGDPTEVCAYCSYILDVIDPKELK
jgi:hypothetical protein